jgi:prophage regulatory protein
MADRLLTWEDLRQRGHPYSRVHTARLEKAGLFPQRVQIGPNRIAWWQSEYEAHCAARPRGPLTVEHLRQDRVQHRA